MPSVDLHLKPFDDGTLIKLEIFEKYLKEWLPVFIHSPSHNTINICDFFAGTGEDNLKNPGSPKIILKLIDVYSELITKNNLKVIEVPITFRKRVGKSKGAGGNKSLAIKVGTRMFWEIITG